ncbi:MAG: nuclear transport factor 2 family protein [Cyclobacteriaceae bacterium]|nr:nuclear transport factor 2 family protein [Cyclobacteriaceae bacterium]
MLLFKVYFQILSMRKSLALLILLCISFIHEMPAQSPTDQQILTLSKKKFDWMIHKNVDSLALVLDNDLRYVHSNGWSETKQEVLDDLLSGKLNYVAVDIHAAQVRLYEQTAIVNGTGKFQVTMNGNPLTIELGYTEVYVKRQGKWLLATRHANRMP